MKIYFKWPNNASGKNFYIKTDSIFGVREVKVNDVDAVKVSNNVYEYYDEGVEKPRRIEIINQMLDNPVVSINDKKVPLFEPTPIVIQALIMLPLIAWLFANWPGIITGLIAIFINTKLNSSLKNNLIKVVIYCALIVLAIVGGIFLHNLIYPTTAAA